MFFSQVVCCVTKGSQSNCKSSLLMSGWELLWVCWWLNPQSVHGYSQLNRECFLLITSLDCISPEYFCCARRKPLATGHTFSFFYKRILRTLQPLIHTSFHKGLCNVDGPLRLLLLLSKYIVCFISQHTHMAPALFLSLNNIVIQYNGAWVY